MKQGKAIISRLHSSELDSFRAFCNDNWGGRHPIINDESLFDYYFREGDNINFVAAKSEDGDFLSVCGFIKASESETPDVWISFILTKKGAPLGLGFKLLEEIRTLTNCRTIACNNIRPKTAGLYEFLGYTVGTLTQYYRLNRKLDSFLICRPDGSEMPPVDSKGAEFCRIASKEDLADFPFEDYVFNRPYKDLSYAVHRYLENPYLKYRLYRIERGGLRALLALRVIKSDKGTALRIVDFIGCRELIGCIGPLVDELLVKTNAEFCDFYSFGVDELMNGAGFLSRKADSDAVIPNYLEPLDMKNVDFWFFTSDTENYAMFKADGDQDRAHLVL